MSERVFLLLKFSFPRDGFTHKHRGKKTPCWYVLACVAQHCWAVRISRACRMSGLILCFQEDAVIVFFAFDDLAVEKFQCLSAARTESHSCLLTMITCACILTLTQICLKQITVWNLVSGMKYWSLFWHRCDLFVVAFLASDLSSIRRPRNAEGVIRQPCAPSYF